MTQKRGRPRTLWHEAARIRVWYGELKRRSDWSDYKLDCEFAWRDNFRNAISTAERPRVFEWIRKTQRKPRGRDPRWRDMNELVDAVDHHEIFRGTKALYHADIWDLFSGKPQSPNEVQGRLDLLLSQFGLIRGPVVVLKDPSNPFSDLVTPSSFFDRCLRISLQRMNRVSALALVWLVFLLTEPSHNAQFRSIVEELADRLLDSFFADFCGEKHFDYYSQAIGTLLASRLDLTDQTDIGYGFCDISGIWPIIPADMVGRLTEKTLFPLNAELTAWKK